jgi:hypothetical protein
MPYLVMTNAQAILTAALQQRAGRPLGGESLHRVLPSQT